MIRTKKPCSNWLVPLGVLLCIGVLAAMPVDASASLVTPFADSGQAAGQLSQPRGVAFDSSTGSPESGRVYVADQLNHRIDVFDSAGAFLFAFGFGVRNGAAELQTCTVETACGVGLEGAGAGQITALNVAVDPTSHDIYASDWIFHRVQKFSPTGEFILMFGKEVNKTAVAEHKSEAEQNVCTAASHDICGAGAVTAGHGGFNTEKTFASLPIAIDSAGHVWVADSGRAQEFSAQGAFLTEVAFSGTGERVVQSFAVDGSGNLYVIYNTGTAKEQGVRKFDSTGAPAEFSSVGNNALDASGHPQSLTLAAPGRLLVSDGTESARSCSLLEFDTVTGAQLRAFGEGQIVSPENGFVEPGDTITWNQSLERGYAVGFRLFPPVVGEIFTKPSPGPLSRALSASPVRGTSATLRAILNAEGAETHYRLQYIAEQQFLENEGEGHPGFTGAKETTVATLAASFAETEVLVPVAELKSETEYRFRLVAENTAGKGNTEEEQALFTTAPPVRIDAVYSSDVGATSARLHAEVNPIGTASEYRFEYLTEAAYQENVEDAVEPFTGATQAPLPAGLLPATEEEVDISQPLTDLSPFTTYRYRLVADNVGGTKASAPFTFRTQATSPFPLLDSRGWEMVSPASKLGARIEPLGLVGGGVIQAAGDGGALAFLASGPTEEAVPGYSNQVEIVSARGPGGWSSHDIAPPQASPSGATIGIGQEYRAFSTDLSSAVLQPFGAFTSELSPQATEQTAYLRTNFAPGEPLSPCSSGCYRPLVTAAEGVADVAPGVHFGVKDDGTSCPPGLCGPQFLGASPDLSHIVLGQVGVGLTPTPGDEGGLYEWSATAPPGEALKLVSVLPNGKPAKPEAAHPSLGFQDGIARHAVSADGSRVFWSEKGGNSHLYLRDTQAEATLQLDAKHGGSGGGPVRPVFQAAAADGSRVFFTDTQALTADAGGKIGAPDLYECQIAEGEGGSLGCILSDLTPRTEGGESASVLTGGNGIAVTIGASEDGSSIYFVAAGALTGSQANEHGEEAQPGQPNLYERRQGVTTFVASLSPLDSGDWSGSREDLLGLTARLSPNGRWLAFMSQRSLTGYDNHDAVSGKPDEEVFLYHAAPAPGGVGTLVCASCNPTGARPSGLEFKQLDTSQGGLTGGDRVWPGDTWLAANLPGWTGYKEGNALIQPRYLSNEGRLFFNSSDALVPADSNGIEDVYEYEAPSGPEAEPPGNTCSTESPAYSPAASGCVDLISSGASGQQSAFLDASKSGGDVFFLTAAKLSARDTDTALDIYDARSGGGEAPPVSPVICQGDACQQPAAPPNDPTPGSLTFSGAGNAIECAKGSVLRGGKCVKKKPARKRKHRPRKHKAKHGRAGAERGSHR